LCTHFEERQTVFHSICTMWHCKKLSSQSNYDYKTVSSQNRSRRGNLKADFASLHPRSLATACSTRPKPYKGHPSPPPQTQFCFFFFFLIRNTHLFGVLSMENGSSNAGTNPHQEGESEILNRIIVSNKNENRNVEGGVRSLPTQNHKTKQKYQRQQQASKQQKD
jgi:hypothetical protein